MATQEKEGRGCRESESQQLLDDGSIAIIEALLLQIKVACVDKDCAQQQHSMCPQSAVSLMIACRDRALG